MGLFSFVGDNNVPSSKKIVLKYLTDEKQQIESHVITTDRQKSFGNFLTIQDTFTRSAVKIVKKIIDGFPM